MKKLIWLVFMLMCVVLDACSDTDVHVKAEQPLPYQIHDYIDSNGCQYVIVYAEEKRPGGGQGVGVGITQKVKQPASCEDAT